MRFLSQGPVHAGPRGRFILHFVALFYCLALANGANASGSEPCFTFDRWAGPPIDVFCSVPEASNPDLPVIVVMHGMSRTAREYHQTWDSLARQHGFVAIVPEFSGQAFPGSRAYNLGNTFDEKGRPLDQSRWSYSAIEPLFDEVRERFGLDAEQYVIYGHSAGAQFVHRFLMHVPETRVSRVVIANAGWYTLPDFDIDWPYGLKGSNVAPRGLSRLLGLDMTILLGDQDTDTGDDSLRKTPEAQKQGPHRLARGYYYLGAGRFAAKKLQMPISWKLGTVQGADHDNAKMAPVAVQFLLP